MTRIASQLALISILFTTGLTNSASVSSAALATPRSAEVAQTATVDWKAVEAAMGRTSVLQPGDIHRFNMPRTDLSVTVDGVKLKPAFALGSWVSFKSVSDGVIAMGDLVLRDDEVARVMSRLQESGIEQTAVHHHLLRESPRIIYMHVHAHGDAVKIAEGLKAALALTGTPGPSPAAVAPAQDPGIDTAAIAKALGISGKMNGGVYQVAAPRKETIRDAGIEIPAVMGVATAINFQPTSGGNAAITGDFVLIASEVNPVMRSLRKSGIEVTSLHNHLLYEEPRLFFMHFWANDDAVRLASGLHEALALTTSGR
jgi:Domain of Unknown Function (DUF1259).